jgi:hypothetical protein
VGGYSHILRDSGEIGNCLTVSNGPLGGVEAQNLINHTAGRWRPRHSIIWNQLRFAYIENLKISGKVSRVKFCGGLPMNPGVINLTLRCKPQIPHETTGSQTQVRSMVVLAYDTKY